jgi:hypothetical protein
MADTPDQIAAFSEGIRNAPQYESWVLLCAYDAMLGNITNQVAAIVMTGKFPDIIFHAIVDDAQTFETNNISIMCMEFDSYAGSCICDFKIRQNNFVMDQVRQIWRETGQQSYQKTIFCKKYIN